jgi:DNA-binding SARP family transcriptional activator
MRVGFPPATRTLGTEWAPRRVCLMSEFQLIVDGVDVSVPHSAQRVIAYLALAQRPVARSRLAGELWLDVPEGRALGNLRSALWRLQRIPSEIVSRADERLTLAKETQVDLDDVAQLAQEFTEPQGCTSLARVRELIAARDILPDWSDEWIMIQRERFRELRLRALERAGEALMEAGDCAMAVQAAMAAVEAEPYRDSSRRLLVRVHLREGNPAAAVRAYEDFRDLLDLELGVAPSESMRRLIAEATTRTL